MKKSLIILAVTLTMMPLSASAWGKLGHATIAEIAERHLTPAAKANIEHYTKGEPLASYGSWMDFVRNDEPYKTEFDGWHASIATPDCKSPLYIRKEKRNCHDAVTAVEYLRVYLKDYREMSDSAVLVGIKCLIHTIGDFHCPVHMRFTDYPNTGKFHVTFLGKDYRYHDFWDSALIQKTNGMTGADYSAYADKLDTWKKSQIRKVTRGWARDWFEDAATDIRPHIYDAMEGDALDESFAETHIGLAETELRKAGYQLAAALNEIFGK